MLWWRKKKTENPVVKGPLLSSMESGSLVIVEVENDGEILSYQTKVDSNIDDGIKALAPTKEGRKIYIDDSSIVHTCVISKKRMLRWKCDFVELYEEEGIWLINLKSKSVGEAFNRRSNYRCSLSRDMVLNIEGNDNTVKAISKDISRSGLGLVTSEIIPMGSIFTSNIETSIGALTVSGIIVRVSSMPGDSSRRIYGSKIYVTDDSKFNKLLSDLQLEEVKLRRT